MKFLKLLFEYIKKFLKIKEKTVQERPTSEKSNIDLENMYSQIVVGDIIWAKRYENEKEKNLIPEGHREGPYIVLQIKDGKLFCTQGTSVVPHEEDYGNHFVLSSSMYNLAKETFFKLYKVDVINEHQVIRILDKLNQKNKDQLFKQIKQLKKIYHTKEGTFIKLDLPIQIGDIISVNCQTFIVIDVNENILICLFLKNHIDYKKSFQLEYMNFNDLDYSKTNCIELNNNIKFINTVNNNVIKSILKSWQEHISNYKNIETTQRGSIILKDNNYYYIYGEEGQDWLSFEISKNHNKNIDKIQIGNDIYYTKYDDLKISKKESFVNIYLCTEKEKDNIKQLRKSYKETRKNIEAYGTPQFGSLKEGDIIENRNYKNKRYIIIKAHKKTYECLSIENLKKAIYNPVIIKKADCKLSKNSSIEGIKWLEKHKNFDIRKIRNQEILNQILQTQIEFLENQHQKKKFISEDRIITLIQQNNYIDLNTIIKTNEFSEETFVVKELLGNMLVCVSTVELGIKNPKKHYFNKNSVIIVEGKQKRK